MSEAIQGPGAARPAEDAGDPAILVARTREDVLVGDELVRHKLLSRSIHWSVAFFFLACLGTGLPIWSPIFGWLAALFGGLTVCAWLHRWTGLVFFASSLLMFFQWAKQMVLRQDEKGWLGPKMVEYLRYRGEDPNVGKYNGGQKLFFWVTALGALGLLATGLVLWFPLSLPPALREAAILLHDFTFILFTMAIVAHVYLGTAAEPGTFGSMTRGTVRKEWAELHHPAWYRDVMKAAKPRSHE